MQIFVSKKGRFLSALLVLAVGVAASLGVFLAVRGWEERRLAYEFKLRAQAHAKTIEDAIEDHVEIARTVIGFFNASETVSREEFSVFTLNIFREHPDVLALDWLPLVPEQARAVYEDKLAQEGFKDFGIKELDQQRNFVPAQTRLEYFPVTYTEPLSKNSFLLGYDEGSDATRLAAIQTARDSGQPAATGRIQLLRGNPSGFGVRVFFPLYQKGSLLTNSVERRQALVGMVSILFHIGQVAESALNRIPPSGIDLTIYDDRASAAERFLYFHPSRLKANSDKSSLPANLDAQRRGLVYSEKLSLADRSWTIVCRPDEVFWFLQNRWQAFAILFTGFLLTGILALYVLALVNREREIRQRVEAQTGEVHRANEEMRKARDYAELLFKLVPSAIFTVDKDHRVRSFNKRAEELTGYSAEEIIGRECTLFALEPCEHKCGAFAADIPKPINARECVIRDKKGKLRQISKNVDLLRNEKGEVVAAIESFEDITERKKAEEALQKAAVEWQKTFDSITDLIFIQDKDHVILKVNTAFAESLKKKPEEIIGKYCFELMHGLHSPWPTCPFEETKKDSCAHTAEVNDPHIGVPLLVTTSPIFDEKGQLAGSVHIAKDITEFKKAEEQLRKAAELKVAFTSMVSHELRTPLTAIKEGIGILADGLIGEVGSQQREFLEIARRNVDRLARLINNVLDFQKLDSGHMEFHFEENDINDVARDVHQTMASLAEKKGLVFQMNLGEALPRIHFDKDKMIQVLTNLVNNALKFTDKGSVVIATSLKENGIQVSVRDTGPGIRAQDLARLFHEFEQLENINDRKTGGTGLGLAISRQIVDQHKGKIWVESEFGQGATFYFLLPFDESKET